MSKKNKSGARKRSPNQMVNEILLLRQSVEALFGRIGSIEESLKGMQNASIAEAAVPSQGQESKIQVLEELISVRERICPLVQALASYGDIPLAVGKNIDIMIAQSIRRLGCRSEEVAVPGAPFDARSMEAIAVIEAPTESDEGMVKEVVTPAAYWLGDALLLPQKVVVYGRRSP